MPIDGAWVVDAAQKRLIAAVDGAAIAIEHLLDLDMVGDGACVHHGLLL